MSWVYSKFLLHTLNKGHKVFHGFKMGNAAPPTTSTLRQKDGGTDITSLLVLP